MSVVIGSRRLRRYAAAAALLAVSLTFGKRAEAACTPAVPADGDVVTCSGTTTNQNDPVGYDFTANNGTVNVVAGASVTGTGSAIEMEHRGTVNNAGSITGSSGVVGNLQTIIVNNSGSILATAGSGVSSTSSGDVNNSGTISGAIDGINVHNGAIVNFSGGAITGMTYGVSIDDVATASNAGTIFGGTTALHFLSINGITSELTNSGTLSSSSDAAVFAGGGLNANNTGFISGMLGISVVKNATIFNAGTIEGITSGVTAQNATIDNTGTIQSLGANSIAIGVTGTVTLNNSGLVRANQSNGEGVSGTTVNVINSGVIEATGNNGLAIGATNTIVNNSGTIRGGIFGVAAGNTANVTNSGLIQANDVGGYAVGANNNLVLNNVTTGRIRNDGIAVFAKTGNITNAGTISGLFGIYATAASSVTNSGTIEGTGGTAIRFSNAADTLTLLPGSRINGVVDFGFGADVVNVNLTAPNSRVSSLTTVVLPTFVNFNGTINTTVSGGGFNGPSVVSGTSLATLDPTAFGQTDRTLLDFTGGVSSLVQGRLGGSAPGAAVTQAVSFAPEPSRLAGRVDDAFAALSPALGYASAPHRPYWKAPDYAAPYTVWTGGFGSARRQSGDDSTLDSNASSWGAAVGVDRRVRPDLLLGAVAGGGSGGLSVDKSSQHVDTDYAFGGVYARLDRGARFYGVSLQGGLLSNRSSRSVINNLAPGGSETASASYHGWYLSPEFSFGQHFRLRNGFVVTPSARLRYLAGFINDYAETGSAQGLAVGNRVFQNLEERGEITVAKTWELSRVAFTSSVHGGVIGLQRVGDTTVNTTLIGQSLSFAAPGKSDSVGLVGGAGFDLRAGNHTTLFGAVEGAIMSDASRSGNVKGGMRVAF